jgi:flagellar biosynthesis protein FlhG
MNMTDHQQPENQGKQMRILSVTGGKGGIGKTTLSVNLAMAFAKMKKKVLLFDADLGLANVDVLLGLTPEKNIYDVLSGDCTLEEACIEGPHGLKIVASASGVQKMADLSSAESVALIQSFSSLTDDIDIMIIDMASGISSQVMDMTHASQDVLVVICNDPSSLMDSYAVIKILHQKYARGRFGIIVNKVKNSFEGHNVFTKFQQTVAKFINISMHYIGHVPYDDYISIAARDRVSVVDKYPQSNAALSFNNMCHGIDHWTEESSLAGGIHFFFERLIQGQPVV